MKHSFLITLSILLAIGCTPDSQPAKEASAVKQPNVLFLIADDWSYPHAGIYGDPVVRTPTFDRIAREGALFQNAYTAAPSCSPSRAAILTGRFPHQLESAGNLWSVFPKKFANWVTILDENGYFTGKTRKGWGPGDFKAGGYTDNPAGKDFASFEEFFAQKPAGTPFSFWFGSTDPHRDYVPNTGIQTGMSLDDVIVPAFLPDLPCVRNDILDYYFEVERFDRESGRILRMLEEAGELDNTIVVMTSDNGMPFPRAKANLYEYGAHMPLAMRFPSKIAEGTVVTEFTNAVDFAPTFVEAAGLDASMFTSGSSLWPLLAGTDSKDRSRGFSERERHANVRAGDLSYPSRSVRTGQYLYIKNFMPDRWPAGDPTTYQSVGQYGDVDNSITKYLIMAMEGKTAETRPDYFNLTFAKRQPEELYDIKKDPFQLHNLALDPEYRSTLSSLQSDLTQWMEATGDLRATNPQTIYWDTVLYTPNYQYHDFDLANGINEYTIAPPFTKEEIPCLDE
ncbi:MAG: sulfatase [Imperialibacter sp.]|uniref:sulfatase family protein n=1 Tax=Imperialibacter sp. TaxID=2038411 RepID=UPI0032EA92C5